ncbi:hypothetical protein [Roseateles sp. P5_D6]
MTTTENISAASSGEEPHCDLVMKGGITSGVIYPKLIYELAQRYRFKNIGGTSAGAIAAGACAAAECGRRGGMAGAFDELRGLPEWLGETVQPSGRSRLLSLFQPSSPVQQHFAVLLQALNKDARPAVVAALFRMLANHFTVALVVFVAGAALLAPLVRSLSLLVSGWSAFGAVIGALVVAGLAAQWAATRGQAWQFVAVMAGVYVLFVLALKIYVGTPWTWPLFGVALSLLIGVLLIWALLVALTAWRFVVTLFGGLHGNGYGLCSGRTMATPVADEEKLPGLTDWLTTYFDKLAGVTDRDHPLTFGDLWGGADRHAPDAVNLEVMTSAVSQQMIYGVPFREGTPTMYYEIGELNRLFPPRVVAWIEGRATAAEAAGPNGLRPDDYAADTMIRNAEGKALRPFPRGADLPVVVAIRMSLSFPVLLSAVPLYSVDYTLTRNQDEKKRMRDAMKEGRAPQAVFKATRIWFSDGGIGSNMPLHMFDALLPGHPSFAINLKAAHPDHPISDPETKENSGGRVYLAEDNHAGALRYWAAPNDGKPLGGLVGFLGSIINTMQNWRDEIQFPYPGYKDRIVQISQRSTEGGLNLDMPAPAIAALGNAGRMAAERLIDRFHVSGAQHGAGWTMHQTIRLRTFLGTMQPGSAALCPSISSGHWNNLASSITCYTVAEQKVAQKFLSGLGALGALGRPGNAVVSLERCALKPVAQIRITPKI